MVFVRGHAMDFDRLGASGAAGWAFKECSPTSSAWKPAHGGEEGWRGPDGPLHVTRGLACEPPLPAFTDAGQEAGYPFTSDYNGAQQEGFGPMEMTVWKGRRWSAANAYPPARAERRPNWPRGLSGPCRAHRLSRGRRATRRGDPAAGAMVQTGAAPARRSMSPALSINSPNC
jgi:choline dehydrogenase